MCSDSEPVGLKVTACDTDQAPRVYLVDTTRGLVIRAGNLETDAYVYITVSCAYYSDDTSSESSESPQLSMTTVHSLPSSQPPVQSISSPSPPVASWVGGTSSILENSATQPPSLPSPIEATAISPTPSESYQSEESLPQVESRFSAVSQDANSSLDQFKGPAVPFPVSLSSRGKLSIQENKPPLWTQHTTPSLEQFESPSLLDSDVNVMNRGPTYVPPPSKVRFHPKIYNPYESLLKGFPSPWRKYTYSPSLLTDTAYTSWAKRLVEHLLPLMTNGAPSWMKPQPTRPLLSWLKNRSLPVLGTGKLLSQIFRCLSGCLYDESDSWSLYQEDPLSLHWSDRLDAFSSWKENQLLSHSVSGGPLRPKYHSTQSHSSKAVHSFAGPLLMELPPSLFSQPIPTEQLQYLQDITPKLLLLLQECASAHSVKDGSPWWSNLPLAEQSNDGIPWISEYASDYTADDYNSWGPDLLSDRYIRYIEESKHSPHKFIGTEYKEDAASSLSEWSDHKIYGSISAFSTEHPPPPPPPPVPWCPKCLPTRPGGDANQSRTHRSSSRYSKKVLSGPLPLVYDSRLVRDDFSVIGTESPMLSSTYRYSMSWVKSPQSATPLKTKTAPAAEQTKRPQSPWSLLSKLLLTYPTFRDSTRVIGLI